MQKSDRLFKIMQMLRGGALHRASDIANAMDVSVRTIYRDMDQLISSGVPIEGVPWHRVSHIGRHHPTPNVAYASRT